MNFTYMNSWSFPLILYMNSYTMILYECICEFGGTTLLNGWWAMPTSHAHWACLLTTSGTTQDLREFANFPSLL